MPASEEMILERNLFVDSIPLAGVRRKLDEQELDEYRRPFATQGEDRLPTFVGPRQLPIGEEPADVHAVCAAYAEWLAATPGLAKLFVTPTPAPS